jgi:nucleoside-diphosphate-sugar epimerase
MSFSYKSINFPRNFIRKIWTTKLTVLVVGSTRILGSKIVAAVFDKGTVEVKAMVRSSNDSHQEKRQKIDEMKAKSAGIVEGDLMKGETLRGACAEVDVIVSAVGNNHVTVPGQKNLIDAAKQQGVKRFVASDYAVDYRQLSLGRERQPGYASAGV